MVRPQAKKGGEIGTNGEFYKGGAFLPSTEKPKGKKKKKSHKQEIEPYVWGLPPEDGMVSIYQRINLYVFMSTGKAIPSMCEEYEVDPKMAEYYFSLYAKGARWIKEESYFVPYVSEGNRKPTVK